MTIGVTLEGALKYADEQAATAAHAAMMEGRDDNWLLNDGARVEGAAIRFSFDNFLPVGRAQDWIDSTRLGVEKAAATAISGAVVLSDPSGHQRVMTALGRAFWNERWTNQQLGFHEAKPNTLLEQHIDALEQATKLRILVPLAGKAEDMRWLAARGHEVVGVEFVIHAVRDFFEEMGVDLWQKQTTLGKFDAFTANGVTMLCEDFLAMTPDEIGTFDAIYDRAALVALEPSTRARYVATCRALLSPGGRIFLIALAYDQKRTHGPPWSVDRAEVEALYGAAPIVATHEVPAPGRLAQAGLSTLEETAYLIQSR